MPRKKAPAKPATLPATKPTTLPTAGPKPVRRGCLSRVLLTAFLLLGVCIAGGVLLAGIRSAGEAVGLLPTRTPTSTPTVTSTPSVTPTATDTPTPTDTPVPTDTPPPTATQPPTATPSVTPTGTVPPIPTDTPPPMATQPPTATPRVTPTRPPAPTATSTPMLVAERILPFAGLSAPDETGAITLVTWNVGLDDADLDVIAERIAAFDGVDLWALQETNPAAGAALEAAAEAGEAADFARVIGLSGNDMRLLSLYNADRFELIQSWEEEQINTTGNARAPLVLALQDRETGALFYFMNNHLYRSRDEERHKQAQLLNDWGKAGRLPVIAAGDYNFDWDDDQGAADHDRGYDLMTAGGAWQWVQPDPIVPTQCGEAWPCSYDDVLDFVFVAGPARAWRAESEIVVTPGDFPDDTSKSDHRPVTAIFWPEVNEAGQPEPPAPTPAAAPASGPVASTGVNLRSGPGTNYLVIGGASAGQPLEVVGRSADGQWLLLTGDRWISAGLVDNAPDGLAVVEAPTAVPAAAPTTARTADAVPVEAPTAAPGPGPTATQPTEPAGAAELASLRIVAMDKGEEWVDIRNDDTTAQVLDGWVLRSERGTQDCPLWGVIQPGETLRIWAMGDATDGFSCGFGSNIWNNSEYDPAVLLTPEGEEVSRLD